MNASDAGVGIIGDHSYRRQSGDDDGIDECVAYTQEADTPVCPYAL